ncbi:MAG: UbiA family prenyltransferase [Cyanobium sp.]
MRAEACLPLMQRLWIYQGERFPLCRHGPLITVFCGAAALYGSQRVGLPMEPAPLLGAIAISGAFFPLMRIADEFKDRDDDRRHRPYRPVPRGLVSLQELARVGMAIALMQLALVAVLAPAAWWLLLLGWLWFALMGVEFLVPHWLRTHLLLYTLSHMVIVPLIALLAAGIAVLPAGIPLPWPDLLPLLGLCFCNGLAIEFARKIRLPQREEPGVETWSALWGLRPALRRWLVVLLLSLPLALAAAWPVGAGTRLLLLLVPLLAWLPRRILLLWRADRHSAPASPPSGASPDRSAAPLELPTGLWTLATYLAVGWWPALTGGG